MSEELNPTTEEATSTEVATETTPVETSSDETTTTAAAPAETPAAEASTESPSAAPETVPSAPAEAAPRNEPAEAIAPLGPSEYVPDPQAGGRSRRTSVNADINDIHYKNVPLLTRFIDQRGRILSRRKTRVSTTMQRRVVKAIKLARHLALLPYTADQTRVVRKRR